MATPDNTDTEMARIESVARSLIPDIVLFFDQNTPNGFIRFRIETRSGVVVAESDEIRSSELAKWSDEDLRHCIRTLGGGRI